MNRLKATHVGVCMLLAVVITAGCAPEPKPLPTRDVTAGYLGGFEVAESVALRLVAPQSGTWALTGGALGDGLTLSAAGKLSGTPTTPGLWSAQLTVTVGATPNVFEVWGWIGEPQPELPFPYELSGTTPQSAVVAASTPYTIDGFGLIAVDTAGTLTHPLSVPVSGANPTTLYGALIDEQAEARRALRYVTGATCDVEVFDLAAGPSAPTVFSIAGGCEAQSDVRMSIDGKSVVVINYLDGVIEFRDTADGAVLRSVSAPPVGLPNPTVALAGAALSLVAVSGDGAGGYVHELTVVGANPAADRAPTPLAIPPGWLCGVNGVAGVISAVVPLQCRSIDMTQTMVAALNVEDGTVNTVEASAAGVSMLSAMDTTADGTGMLVWFKSGSGESLRSGVAEIDMTTAVTEVLFERTGSDWLLARYSSI